jgi:hypothetical protein
MADEADSQLPEIEDAAAHYVWQYFTVTNHSNPKKGGSKNAVCMFCDKIFSGCGTSRAAAHILGRPVMGREKAGIHPCIAINRKDDDRRGALRNAQKQLGEVIHEKEQTISGKKRKQQAMDELLTSATKQSRNDSSIGSQKSGSKDVDAMIASFFYENGIAFNVADSSSFQNMIDECMKFSKQNPFQSYKTPSRKKLSGELLDKAYESTEQLIAPHLAAAKKFGVTIASDGWSDPRRRPILNFMASTRGASIFLKSVDCTDHMAEGGKKDAAYIGSNLISVIKDFGAQDVVQVIQDGANKATWPIIEKEFPWIICSWCVAHVIDLWFEDIGKMTFFKDIWEQGKMVVVWIRGHQAFAAKFGKLTRKALLLPGESVHHPQNGCRL